MTPEEAIEILEEVKELDDTLYAYNNVYMEALEVALSVLKEIQQYREIGTVEQVKNQKENLNVSYQIIGDYEQYGTIEDFKEAQRWMRLVNAHGTIGRVIDSCAEYEEIGTVEQYRDAVVKLSKAEKALNTILSGNYNNECNFCVHNDNLMANCHCISGDGSWCIHNAKWNGEISDNDNLEGMEDE